MQNIYFPNKYSFYDYIQPLHLLSCHMGTSSTTNSKFTLYPWHYNYILRKLKTLRSSKKNPGTETIQMKNNKYEAVCYLKKEKTEQKHKIHSALSQDEGRTLQHSSM